MRGVFLLTLACLGLLVGSPAGPSTTIELHPASSPVVVDLPDPPPTDPPVHPLPPIATLRTYVLNLTVCEGYRAAYTWRHPGTWAAIASGLLVYDDDASAIEIPIDNFSSWNSALGEVRNAVLDLWVYKPGLQIREPDDLLGVHTIYVQQAVFAK